MFTNLIESSSHAKEFKRRGSFVVFTTITYGVLLVATGVVSVYAYDARLEQQNLEMIVFLDPRDLVPEVRPPAAAPTERPRSTADNNNNKSNIPMREIEMAPVNTPEAVPNEISSTPNKNLPVPAGPYKIGPDYNPPGVGGDSKNSTGTDPRVSSPPQRIEIEEPPAPEIPKTPKVLYKGPITSQAISLPKPLYPPIAKQMGIQGAVSVQVLIDESGKVISAKAVGGSPFLMAEAQKAAFQARFSPTMLNDQAVKVSGVITYNFVLNR